MREPAFAATYHAPARGPQDPPLIHPEREPPLSELRWVQVIEGNWEFAADKRALAGANKKP